MIEKLLTKLPPKEYNVDCVSKGTKHGINAYNIAAALSYGAIPQPAYLLTRTKYSEDVQAAKQFLEHVVNFVSEQIMNNNLPIGSGSIKGIATLLMQEGVSKIKCTSYDTQHD